MKDQNLQKFFSDFLRFRLQNKIYSIASFWIGFFLAISIALLFFFAIVFNSVFNYAIKHQNSYHFIFEADLNNLKQLHNNMNYINLILLWISLIILIIWILNFVFWYLKQFRKFHTYLKAFSYIYREESQIYSIISKNKWEKEFQLFKDKNFDFTSTIMLNNIIFVFSNLSSKNKEKEEKSIIWTKPGMIQINNFNIDLNQAFIEKNLVNNTLNNFDHYLSDYLKINFQKAVLFKFLSYFLLFISLFFTIINLAFSILFTENSWIFNTQTNYYHSRKSGIIIIIIIFLPLIAVYYPWKWSVSKSLLFWFNIYLASSFMLKQRSTIELSSENERKLENFVNISDKQKIIYFKSYVDFAIKENKEVFDIKRKKQKNKIIKEN